MWRTDPSERGTNARASAECAPPAESADISAADEPGREAASAAQEPGREVAPVALDGPSVPTATAAGCDRPGPPAPAEARGRKRIGRPPVFNRRADKAQAANGGARRPLHRPVAGVAQGAACAPEGAAAGAPGKLQVFVRIRPASVPGTVSSEAHTCLHATSARALAIAPPEGHPEAGGEAAGSLARTFDFTRVFDEATTQRTYYEAAAAPLVRRLLDRDGEEGLVLAYGVTGSGKTHSLEGTPEDPGLIPRALADLFKAIEASRTAAAKEAERETEALGVEGRRTRSSAGKAGGPREGAEAGAADGGLAEVAQAGAGGAGSDPAVRVGSSPTGSGAGVAAADARRSAPPIEPSAPPPPALHEVRVMLSACEIYNEEIHDLLAPIPPGPRARPRQLHIRSCADGRVVLDGQARVEVASLSEALAAARRAAANRARAGTALNAASSRSHCIFAIELIKRESEEDSAAADGGAPGAPSKIFAASAPPLSRLCFADLAGSERAQRTGNTGRRLKESSAINGSLMVLGQCLEKTLYIQTHPLERPLPVVPYRGSKITHLFRDALHGYGAIVLAVCVSPVQADYSETMHVLGYASKASRIGTVSGPPPVARVHSRRTVDPTTARNASRDAEEDAGAVAPSRAARGRGKRNGSEALAVRVASAKRGRGGRPLSTLRAWPKSRMGGAAARGRGGARVGGRRRTRSRGAAEAEEEETDGDEGVEATGEAEAQQRQGEGVEGEKMKGIEEGAGQGSPGSPPRPPPSAPRSVLRRMSTSLATSVMAFMRSASKPRNPHPPAGAADAAPPPGLRALTPLPVDDELARLDELGPSAQRARLAAAVRSASRSSSSTPSSSSVSFASSTSGGDGARSPESFQEALSGDGSTLAPPTPAEATPSDAGWDAGIVSDLQRQLAEAEERAASAEATARQESKAEMEELLREMDASYRRRLDSARAAIRDPKRALAQALERADELEDALAAATKAAAEAVRGRDEALGAADREARRGREALAAAAVEAQAQCARLAATVAARDERVAELTNALAEAEEGLRAARASAEGGGRKALAAETRAREAEERAAAAEAEVEQAAARAAAAEAEVEQAAARAAASEARAAAAEAAACESRSRLSAALAQASDAEERASRAEVAGAEAKNAAAAAAAALVDAKARAVEAARKASAKLDELQASATALKGELEGTTAKWERAKRAAVEHRSRADGLEVEKKRLEEALSDAKAALSQAGGEGQELSKRFERAKKAAGEHRERAAAFERELESVRQAQAAAEAALEASTRERDSTASRLVELEEAIGEARARGDDLERRLEEAVAELGALREAAAGTLRERDELHERIERAEIERDEANARSLALEAERDLALEKIVRLEGGEGAERGEEGTAVATRGKRVACAAAGKGVGAEATVDGAGAGDARVSGGATAADGIDADGALVSSGATAADAIVASSGRKEGPLQSPLILHVCNRTPPLRRHSEPVELGERLTQMLANHAMEREVLEGQLERARAAGRERLERLQAIYEAAEALGLDPETLQRRVTEMCSARRPPQGTPHAIALQRALAAVRASQTPDRAAHSARPNATPGGATRLARPNATPDGGSGSSRANATPSSTPRLVPLSVSPCGAPRVAPAATPPSGLRASGMPLEMATPRLGCRPTFFARPIAGNDEPEGVEGKEEEKSAGPTAGGPASLDFGCSPTSACPSAAADPEQVVSTPVLEQPSSSSSACPSTAPLTDRSVADGDEAFVDASPLPFTPSEKSRDLPEGIALLSPAVERSSSAEATPSRCGGVPPLRDDLDEFLEAVAEPEGSREGAAKEAKAAIVEDDGPEESRSPRPASSATLEEPSTSRPTSPATLEEPSTSRSTSPAALECLMAPMPASAARYGEASPSEPASARSDETPSNDSDANFVEEDGSGRAEQASASLDDDGGPAVPSAEPKGRAPPRDAGAATPEATSAPAATPRPDRLADASPTAAALADPSSGAALAPAFAPAAQPRIRASELASDSPAAGTPASTCDATLHAGLSLGDTTFDSNESDADASAAPSVGHLSQPYILLDPYRPPALPHDTFADWKAQFGSEKTPHRKCWRVDERVFQEWREGVEGAARAAWDAEAGALADAAPVRVRPEPDGSGCCLARLAVNVAVAPLWMLHGRGAPKTGFFDMLEFFRNTITTTPRVSYERSLVRDGDCEGDRDKIVDDFARVAEALASAPLSEVAPLSLHATEAAGPALAEAKPRRSNERAPSRSGQGRRRRGAAPDEASGISSLGKRKSPRLGGSEAPPERVVAFDQHPDENEAPEPEPGAAKGRPARRRRVLASTPSVARAMRMVVGDPEPGDDAANHPRRSRVGARRLR